jgi:DNA polymerase-3 subunit delta'
VLANSTLWANIVGQDDALGLLDHAIENPVHAYLFLGPAGSGKRQAARAFAAALLCRNGQCGECRDCTLALHGEHPDVTEVERVGAAISAEQANEIVRSASFSPVEGDRKVLILDEFHLLSSSAAARLLKTIEEPPAGTVFCVLADQLVPDLITIASRCVRVPFHAVPERAIADALVESGIDEHVALEAARASGGNLDRARLLATDAGLFQRREAFASVAHRVNGSGSRVVALIDELLGLIDDAAEPLKARHAQEVAELDARVAQTKERGSGRKSLEERHKRELRRYRTDELRSGLSTIAGAYRDRLVAGVEGRRGLEDAAAVDRIIEAIAHLDRNPNETLLLQSLLLSLPPI